MSIRKAAVILLTVISMLTVCSCGLWGEEETREYMELTQEEKELLCKLYINDEKISQGELLSYQVRTVEQYRYAKETLERKYPSYEFDIFYCAPQTIADEHMMLYFEEPQGEETNQKVYTMYVYEEEEGYSAEDNFYGKIFSPKYEAYLYENLQEVEPDIAKVKSGISSPQGDEYDENMTVEDMLSGKVEISSDTSIFILRENVSEKEGEEIFDGVKHKIINDLRLEGTYQVMIINDKDLLEKAKNKAISAEECLYKKIFHTWEEEE